MKIIAENRRDDNYNMAQIAQATKLDSDIMKTIAILTTFFLLSTLVAVSKRTTKSCLLFEHLYHTTEDRMEHEGA